MSNDVETHQHANSYITIESSARIPGMSVSEFQTPAEPTINNIQSLTPVATEMMDLIIENCNERNNFFTVNGVQVTIPTGHYQTGANIAAALQSALVAVFGAGSVVVANISTYPQTHRFRFTAVAPFTVDAVTPYFTRWTGVIVDDTPSRIKIFEYTRGFATLYVDVCAHELQRGQPDNTASKSSTGIIFRVPWEPSNPGVTATNVLQMASTKKIFYPQRTAWPRTVWRLVDEWGLNIIAAPGSEYWIIFKTDYYQPQIA